MSARRTPQELEELVMVAVRAAPRPVTAHQLAAALTGERLAPQQAYRTLARLTAAEKVVRIETLRAYRADAFAGGTGPVVFCRECHAAMRMACPRFHEELQAAARRIGFRPDRLVVEASGLCEGCAARGEITQPAVRRQ